MKSTVLGLRISAVIFAIISLGHLLRIVTHIQVTLANVSVPLWASILVVIVSGALAVWLWSLARLGSARARPGAAA